MKKYLDFFVEVIKKYGDFKTRSGKTEFWVFTLIYVIASAILGAISYKLSSLLGIVLLVPSLAVGVRRLHDIGKSGTNMLWGFLPVIGWIYLIILFLKDGEPEANKWGNPPAEINFDDTEEVKKEATEEVKKELEENKDTEKEL